MRKVVEEEGLEARNLLKWNVIVSDKMSLEVPKTSKKPPTSPRPQSASPRPVFPQKDGESRIRASDRCSSLGRPKTRLRSSSAGRNPDKCVRARYWAFLFENLYRAVDEIYQTCEVDESIAESKEAIMMLENYCKEFQALIQWLNISKNYEVTPPRNRPTSLAWDVRKSLPAKGLLRNIFLDKLGASGSNAKRKIDLQGNVQSTAIQTDCEDELLRKTASSDEGFTESNTHTETNNDDNLLSVSSAQTNDIVVNEVSSNNEASSVKLPSAAIVKNDLICDSCLTAGDSSDSLDGKIQSIEVPIVSVKSHSMKKLTFDSCVAIVGSEENLVVKSFPAETPTIAVESVCVENVATDNSLAVVDSINDLSGQTVKTEVPIEKVPTREYIPTKEMLVESVLTNKHTSTKETAVETVLTNELISTKEMPMETVPTNELASDTCSTTVDKLLENTTGIEIAQKFDVEFLGRDELEDVEVIEHDTQEESAKKSLEPQNLDLASEDVTNTSENSVLEKCESGTEICSTQENKENNMGSVNVVISALTEKSTKVVSVVTESLDGDNIPVESGSSVKTSVSTGSQTDVETKGEKITVDKKVRALSEKNELQNRNHPPSSVSKAWKPVTTHVNTTVTKSYPIKTAASVTARQTKANITAVSQGRRIIRTDVNAKNSNETKMTNVSVNSSEKATYRIGNSSANAKRAVHSSSVFTRGNIEKPVNQSSTMGLSQRLRPSQHHLGKDLSNLSKKSGSNTSLNSNSGTKVAKSNTRANCDGNFDNEEDSDGWETVRGRTRCKNSPAKKIQSSNGAYDRAVAAKISQTKIGGFPYTCTSNLQPVLKKASKPGQISIKSTQHIVQVDENKSEQVSKPVDEVSDLKTVYKKVAKENVKSDIVRKIVKVAPLKPDQNVLKISKSAKGNPVGISKQLSNSVKKEISVKVPTKASPIERQLSMGNINRRKSDKLLQSKINLQRAYSNSSVEVKKKTNLEKISDDSTKISTKALIVNDDNPEKENLINCLAENENSNEKEDNIQEIKSHGSIESIDSLRISALRDKSHTELESVKQDSELFLADGNHHDSDLGTMSDDQDGLVSNDEGFSDAQTLEMYEKMIREEAQEHISELGLSWGDQMDLLDMELRTPGRALQMHEKLSSPFRKRTLAETIRRQEEKQLKAQEQRERFLEEKAQRFKDIQKKVEEMKAFNEKRQEQQRISLEQRLQRAEEKRKKELEKIVKKAHDEEEKVNEIAFINSLEAQNKRHDLISKEKDHEARLQDIQGERQRKLEEKAAKEAAAEERRKVLEAERQARLLEMQEKRKQRDLKIEQQLLEKEKERQELANQKAREREFRISALNAAQQASLEELQKKIQLKQEESARRHEENMEQIRQKAFELSVRRYSSNNDDVPQLVPYETKKICTICNVLIGSEVYLLSHLRGKKHQEMISDRHQGHDPSTEELELYNLKHIVDASTDQLDPNIALDKERLKALKKRCKKLRQRMANRGMEFEETFESKPVNVTSKRKQKSVKLISEIKKYASCTQKCPWDTNSVSTFERLFTELDQLFSKCTTSDKIDFRSLGGVGTFMDVLIKIATPISNNNTLVPSKVIIQSCKVGKTLFKDCYENSIYVLLCNKIGVALDALNHRLRVLIPDNFNNLVSNSSSMPGFPPVDEVAGELMCFLGIILDYLAKKKMNDSAFWDAVAEDLPENKEEEFQLRINDIVSYIVSIGIVDRLTQYFNSVRGGVDSNPIVATFLLHSMSFLMSLVKLSSESYTCSFERKKPEDATQLIATLKMTDLVGAVSLLYCILLHGWSPSLGETPPPKLPDHTILLTLAALRMLNHSAVLNLHIVQSILGNEGLSLQLRHITNYLLWYCKHWEAPDVLHEILLLIGYFTALNHDNQLIIQVGQRPSVLKQLSTLPFQYFSNRQLTDILFPTLISCCFNSDSNKAMLQLEMSIELLSHYVEGYLLDVYNVAQVKNDPNVRWRLSSRFPKCKWTAAKLYFAKPTEE